MKSRTVFPRTSRFILALYLVSMALSLAAGAVPLFYYLNM